MMKLKKELGLLDVFCLASGAMISSGLFILPGMAHARAGPAVIASYFLAALFALTGLLSQAELVSSKVVSMSNSAATRPKGSSDHSRCPNYTPGWGSEQRATLRLATPCALDL